MQHLDAPEFSEHMDRYIATRYGHLPAMHQKWIDEGLPGLQRYCAAHPDARHQLEHYAGQLTANAEGKRITLTTNKRGDGYLGDITDRPVEFTPLEITRLEAARELHRKKLLAGVEEDADLPEAVRNLIGTRRMLGRVNQYLIEFPGANYRDAEAFAKSDSESPASWKRFGR
jgi:hypothetical protein